MKKYFIIASIVLLASACSKQPVVTQPTPPVQTPPVTTAPPADPTAGWTSYKSPDKYSFSFKYPSDFGFNTDVNQVKGLAYIPVCDDAMVACAYLAGNTYPKTNFDGAGISVNVYPDLKTAVQCYNFKVATNAAQNQVPDVSINGVVFKSATGGDAGAGHSEQVQVYRNFHNNQCYEISQHIGSTAIGNYPEGTVTQFNTDEVTQKLQGVVNTFEFSIASGISDVQAIQIVTNLPEVQDFISRVKSAKGDPHVAADPGQPVLGSGGSSSWSIHVFESLPDHNATFGWYSVDAITGKVTPQT